MDNNKITTFLLIAIPLSMAGYFQTSYAFFSHAPKKHVVQAPSETTRIDINHADAKELTKLKGVGMKRAKILVAYRNAHGPFRSINDLTKVRGFNNKTIIRLLAMNKNRLAMGVRKK